MMMAMVVAVMTVGLALVIVMVMSDAHGHDVMVCDGLLTCNPYGEPIAVPTFCWFSQTTMRMPLCVACLIQNCQCPPSTHHHSNMTTIIA